MNKYEEYVAHMQQIADLKNATAVLSWDQEVYMPKNSAPRRARQLSTLAGLAHEKFTSEKTQNLLSAAAAMDLDPKQRANVSYTQEEYDKYNKVPTAFVQETSEAVSKAFVAWNKAKQANDFNLYANELDALLQLKLKESEILGYDEHPYDAQLDIYEKGMTVGQLEVLFGEVKSKLFPFIEKIYQADQVSDDLMYQHFAQDDQWEFGMDILRQIGYDFDGGRQDISSHPFTTNFSATDVRVTTRMDENNLSEMLWSTIHEGGHALYEQGLKDEYYGLPMGSYLTLGIHESQSRLWENNVGRSLPFWEGNFPDLQKRFGNQLSNYTANDFYKAMNKVQPSPIRTNADELTYHFHILIRYEIEKAMFEQTIKIGDVKDAWNSMYKKYLNLDIANDNDGILQDIHWSHGSFGYFPTYSIGSFYAAQMYAKAEDEIEGLSDQIKGKNPKQLLAWLRNGIHQHGRQFTANELCKQVTGEELNFDHFMKYATEKYSGIYNLS